MRAQEFAPNKENKEKFVEMFAKFLPLAMHHIGLKRLPKIVFEKSIGDIQQPTFGMYVNDEKTLYVALANRHPNDILRTVAHELTHFKQDTHNELNDDSGTTGSPEENEANAVAGIVMRHFNKKYPQYLAQKPVIAESKQFPQEASYPGNIGIMELTKFFQQATPEQKQMFKELLAHQDKKSAWKMVQRVLGVKLHPSVTGQ
jgi:hypothetical protein